MLVSLIECPLGKKGGLVIFKLSLHELYEFEVSFIQAKKVSDILSSHVDFWYYHTLPLKSLWPKFYDYGNAMYPFNDVAGRIK
jgi:hypothetical protein